MKVIEALVEFKKGFDRTIEERWKCQENHPECGRSYIPYCRNELLQAVRYALYGGERIRPFIIQTLAKALGEQCPPKVAPLALAIEYIFTAGRIFDNIIDYHKTDKGRKTLHTVFGLGKAIICANYLTATAFKELSNIKEASKLPHTLEAYSTMLQEICERQYQEQTLLYRIKTMRDYRELKEGLAAKVLSSALKATAQICSAPPSHVEAAEAYGKNMGIALQLAADYRRALIEPVERVENLEGNALVVLLREEVGDIHIRSPQHLTKLIEEHKLVEKLYKIAEHHLQEARKAAKKLGENKYTQLLAQLASLKPQHISELYRKIPDLKLSP